MSSGANEETKRKSGWTEVQRRFSVSFLVGLLENKADPVDVW